MNLAEQPRTLSRWLERLEGRHGLAAGSLRLEMMVETTQAFVDADGRCPLPGFLDACEGRCSGARASFALGLRPDIRFAQARAKGR